MRGRTAWLEGVDLSAAMVEQARRKGVYDRLEVGDAVATLRGATDRFDIVIAADVVAYVGNLESLLAAVRAASVPGGRFAFSARARPATGSSSAATTAIPIPPPTSAPPPKPPASRSNAWRRPSAAPRPERACLASSRFCATGGRCAARPPRRPRRRRLSTGRYASTEAEATACMSMRP
jgi:SAM-dependent methyltransferase